MQSPHELVKTKAFLVHDLDAAGMRSKQLIDHALGITAAKKCADAHGETTAERNFSY